MRKLALVLLLASVSLSLPVMAKETTVIPDQGIENTKSYTGINYNRQDSEQVGTQKIVNDHSWFNININMVKKGALFKKDEKEVIVGTEEAK